MEFKINTTGDVYADPSESRTGQGGIILEGAFTGGDPTHIFHVNQIRYIQPFNYNYVESQISILEADQENDQSWFFSKEWQEGEKLVDLELAQGKYKEFNNMDDAIEYLNS